MKKSIIAVLSLLAASACADPILIHVTATAGYGGLNLGYNYGQSYTFTWEVNDDYVDLNNPDDFINDHNRWANSPELWTDFSGQGLSGDFNASTAGEMLVSSSGFVIDVRNITGLTANGYNVTTVYVGGLDIDHVDYSDTSYVNPATWLARYIGTHNNQTDPWIYLYTASDGASFTPTSVTIEAIPEPAAVSTTVLTALAALFIRRRCSSALSHRR